MGPAAFAAGFFIFLAARWEQASAAVLGRVSGDLRILRFRSVVRLFRFRRAARRNSTELRRAAFVFSLPGGSGGLGFGWILQVMPSGIKCAHGRAGSAGCCVRIVPGPSGNCGPSSLRVSCGLRIGAGVNPGKIGPGRMASDPPMRPGMLRISVGDPSLLFLCDAAKAKVGKKKSLQGQGPVIYVRRPSVIITGFLCYGLFTIRSTGNSRGARFRFS